MRLTPERNSNRKGESKLAKDSFNWGAPVEEFPSGLWDDFDGKIELIEYEAGEFNTQIHAAIRPAEYEYEARDRDYDPDSDEGLPQQWWSMGGSGETYEVSEDGLSVEGPAPTKQTRAFKFMMSAREYGKVKLKGTSLEAMSGESFHFKSKDESSTNPQTKERVTRAVLYIAGPAVGKAIAGDAKKSAGSSGSASEERSESRRSRRQASEDTPTDDSGSSDDSSGEEETPTPSRRRRRSQASESEPDDQEKAEETKETETESESGATDTLGAAFSALVKVVEAAGGDGLRRRSVNQKLLALEDDVSADVIKLAAQKDTLDAAVTNGILEEEDRILFLPAG